MSTLTPVQEGKSIFRPRARIIKTIGEELISNDVVAIIELVKNSYDAEASIITIKFSGEVREVEESQDGKKKKQVKNILIPETGQIIIEDDGLGMNLDTVKTAWMEPATISKKGKSISGEKNRRFTGEKGIGRFATAKLAKQLKMITKEKNDNEIIATFDWKAFADEEKYLDQIECEWSVQEAKDSESQGTILQLDMLNTAWDEDKFRELRIALSRLINPVKPVLNFLIELDLPEEFAKLSGIVEPPSSLNKPDYLIKGQVDSDGIAEMMYFSKKYSKEEIIKEEIKVGKPLRKPVCGNIDFEFRVWDRESESLGNIAKEVDSSVKNIKTDLDNLGGISIYRDFFRVLPYGENKNDWLRLDLRRVNNPTMRLSNNQIVGYISISLDSNSELKDQSNREGIVESLAFNDLKELIIKILSELETKRYAQRPRESESIDNERSLFGKFSVDDLVDQIKVKVPNDKEVHQLLNQAQQRISSGVKKVQEVLSRYRRLSTLGLLIDSVLHDGNNFLASIDGSVKTLQKAISKDELDVSKISEKLESIDSQRKVLRNLFKRIEPFGGRKRGKPSKIILEDSIKSVLELKKSDIDKLGVEVKITNTRSETTIDESEFQIIIMNMLTNSLYWLEQVDNERKIQIDLKTTESEVEILFSDSGPGVDEELHESIFDPYFSKKPDGIGLGLTIVGELVNEYDGELTLIDNGPLDGANFRLTFRRRI